MNTQNSLDLLSQIEDLFYRAVQKLLDKTDDITSMNVLGCVWRGEDLSLYRLGAHCGVAVKVDNSDYNKHIVPILFTNESGIPYPMRNGKARIGHNITTLLKRLKISLEDHLDDIVHRLYRVIKEAINVIKRRDQCHKHWHELGILGLRKLYMRPSRTLIVPRVRPGHNFARLLRI